MNLLRTLAVSFLLFPTTCLIAQAPTTAARPTAPVPLIAAPTAMPVVHDDRSVTFELAMPHAEHVDLSLEGAAAPMPMTKAPGADGHWTLTVPALAPEFYSYTFIVDGTDIIDPRNTLAKSSFFRVESVFLVPAHQLWEVRDVPHGVVSAHDYTSAIVKRQNRYYVYTPPGFNAAEKKVYPVLYLLHGYSDESSAWTSMARANTILDNLIAEGKAKPMIAVMPLGYGDMDMINRGWVAWRDADLVRRNFQLFGQALYSEVMPRVRTEYPISSRREDHAIAGLSMGGAETLLVGLNHTKDFSWIGAFSAGGLGSTGFDQEFPVITPSTSPAIDASLKLLWISCGTEDGLLEPNQKLIAWLQQQGMHPKVVETPGRHTWMVWRDNFAHFAPLLFQPAN